MECLVDRRPTFYPTARMSGSMERMNNLWTLIEIQVSYDDLVR